MMPATLAAPTRRALLLGSGALLSYAYLPRAASAEPRDPRFLAIVLRGGLDGLAVVAPVGDPDWRKLRGDKALTLDGASPALPLDDFFALNPAMPNLHRLYRAGQALVVHAVATPYRERSHFDGQDVLESGLPGPGATDTGWLNRALSTLTAGGSAAAQVRRDLAEAAGAGAKFLARPDGPRVGALSLNGWDTHINEGADKGRLADLLGALDGAIGAVEIGMGAAWPDTVVALVTEFGRTARINGNDGTDHGTATAALFAGGALKGGRVVADWPGLKESDLHEKRDLKPTTDLRAVLKGLLRDHLRVDERHLETAVFPDSAAARPTEGLLA